MAQNFTFEYISRSISTYVSMNVQINKSIINNEEH